MTYRRTVYCMINSTSSTLGVDIADDGNNVYKALITVLYSISRTSTRDCIRFSHHTNNNKSKLKDLGRGDIHV